MTLNHHIHSASNSRAPITATFLTELHVQLSSIQSAQSLNLNQRFPAFVATVAATATEKDKKDEESEK